MGVINDIYNIHNNRIGIWIDNRMDTRQSNERETRFRKLDENSIHSNMAYRSTNIFRWIFQST